MTKRFEQRIYEFEGFRLDAASAMLYRDRSEVSLPLKAVETLLALVERSGQIVPKDELMSIIWTDSIVEESNLSQYLHVLRKTLGTTSSGKPFIETLKGRGYRFNGEVTKSLTRGSGAAEEIVLSHASGRKAVPHRGVRVERHGNVLAVADWQENEADDSSKPERYPQINTARASDSHPKWRARHFYAGAASALALTLIVFSIVWFNSAADTNTVPAKRDLTFLNLTSGEDVNFATISPDGVYFVYASQDGDTAHLWLQQTGQARRQEIVTPFAGTINGTTFTPDSQFVYFTAREGRDAHAVLYRVPALGGVRARILTGIDTTVSFSPDGREMVFGRRNNETSRSFLIIASSDGKGERVLLTRSGEDAVNEAAWSPDGALIAYGAVRIAIRRGQCTIAGIDPKSGETRVLSGEKWDNCFRMAWTPDGEGLVIAGTKFNESSSTQRDQIYYLSIADGESRRLTTDGSRHQFASLGVTDKNEILAVPYNRLSQIWAMDAGGDSRTAVQITTGFADGRSGIAPLFSDGRIAYLTRHGDGFSVWMVNADGSDRRQVTADPLAIEELRSDPGGRFFVFSALRDTWPHLHRVDANGGDLTQLTFGETQEVDSTVSPDGNWIVYDSYVFNGTYGKPALWKIPSGGGEPVALANIDCKTPHFSPDGKFISCVANEARKISIVSMETGEATATFQTIKSSTLNVGSRWTPDGKALTYIVQNKNVGNIWLHEIDSGRARPLTDFTSGEIYNYAFSIDGSRLLVARGYPTRNAVLIKNFR